MTGTRPLVEKQQQTNFFYPLPDGALISLHNEDYLSGLERFPSASIDVVVTSPPYNLGVRYKTYDDKIERDEYLNWIERVFITIKEKLKDDGSIFLNLGSSPTNPWGPFETIMRLKPHFVLQNTISWVKYIYIDAQGTLPPVIRGHYKPLQNSYRFLNDTHEYIFHLTKQGDVSLDRLAIGVPAKRYDARFVDADQPGCKGQVHCRGNTWYIPYETDWTQKQHPASFPVLLPEMCIKLHGAIGPKSVVLDPFMGIGNTSLACKKLGVSCIGFEMDSQYFNENIKQLLSRY